VLKDLILRIESSKIQIWFELKLFWSLEKVSKIKRFPISPTFFGLKSPCTARWAHFLFFFSFPFLFQHTAQSRFQPVLHHLPVQPPPAQWPSSHTQPSLLGATDSFVLTTPTEAGPSARAASCRAPMHTRCHTDLDSARVHPRLARTPSSYVHTTITLILLLRAWSRIKMERNQESNPYQIRKKLLRNLSIRLEISIGTFLCLDPDS
jgi:hypothetical protein